MARDEARRLELANRITRLREDSPHTQQVLADFVGVSLRGYQKWEEGGGILWEHLEKLAEIHGVDLHWLARGEERPGTPEAMEALGALQRQLETMEEKLDRLLSNSHKNSGAHNSQKRGHR